MRLSLALVALVFSGTVACGGAISIEPGEDTGTDTGGDTDLPPDALPDTMPDGPSTCGFGACSTATSCFDGCNECWCSPPGDWSCTTKACVDSGPGWDTAPPPPVCPPYFPAPGSWCPGPLKCSYPNSCGSSDSAWCDYPGSTWKTSTGPCAGTCPAVMPKEGTACLGPAKCEYWKSCGTSDQAYCDPSTGRWKTYYSDCPTPPPPPPPPTCPTSPPKSGSACSMSWTTCAWNNGCGAVIEGYCEGGSWWLSDPGCVPGCPASKPPSGTACKPPSSMACTYLAPSPSPGFCESNCFCAEDYRWACIPGGCSSGGGGGWEDAGPPPPFDAGF